MNRLSSTMPATAMTLMLLTSIGQATSAADDFGNWERMRRTVVYNSPQRARYPSIAIGRGGYLFVLFTQQTADQEHKGLGDLLLARSNDRGKTWSAAKVVYRGEAGEPRAIGTLTVLNSGRIIAPFVEWIDGGTRARFALLSSTDHGSSWTATSTRIESPLDWLQPTGRIVETNAGDLIMAVHGAESKADLKATIHSCGLLRSTDGGQSWGDFSWLAHSDQSVIGSLSTTRFSFERPAVAVHTARDGSRSWVGLVSARRLGEGPDSPMVIVRVQSDDEGRTWSQPDQLTVGAWPCLTMVDDHTSFCAFSCYASWGDMRALFSDKGFETFRQERPLLQRCWLSGMTYGKDEIPLPPLVPYQNQKWKYDHYGFPSAVALDQDHVAVAFGRTQRGTVYWNPRGLGTEHEMALDVPLEQERIELVVYDRHPVPDPPAIPRPRAPHPTGRWVMARRFKPQAIARTQLPNGDLLGVSSQGEVMRSSDGIAWSVMAGSTIPGDIKMVSDTLAVLRSGRWLAAQIINSEGPTEGQPKIVGDQGGYPIHKGKRHAHDSYAVMQYSDDEGKTWHQSQTLRDPLQWVWPLGRFVELDDGTILVTVYGTLTEEDQRVYAGSNGVFRSTDGGKTWGDFSVIFTHGPKSPGIPQPDPRYSELDIQPLPDGWLFALSRTEYTYKGLKGIGGLVSRSYSSDQGRSWSMPQEVFSSGGQQTLLRLPDGSMLVSQRSHSWQQPGMYVTHDYGRSWSYTIGGPYSTYSAFLIGKDRIVVYAPSGGAVDDGNHQGALYQWVESSQGG